MTRDYETREARDMIALLADLLGRLDGRKVDHAAIVQACQLAASLMTGSRKIQDNCGGMEVINCFIADLENLAVAIERLGNAEAVKGSLLKRGYDIHFRLGNMLLDSLAALCTAQSAMEKR